MPEYIHSKQTKKSLLETIHYTYIIIQEKTKTSYVSEVNWTKLNPTLLHAHFFYLGEPPKNTCYAKKIHIHSTASHISDSKLPESYSVSVGSDRKKSSNPITRISTKQQKRKRKKDEQDRQILLPKCRRRRSQAAVDAAIADLPQWALPCLSRHH